MQPTEDQSEGLFYFANDICLAQVITFRFLAVSFPL